MTNPPRQPDPLAFRSENEFDDVFGYGNPNPERVGCPSREVLRALSRRERPIEDPGYEHVANCSPCFREFRAFQQARAARRKRAWWLVRAAAVVLIGSVGAWFILSFDRGGVSQNETLSRARPVTQQIDLRKYAVMRGEPETDMPPVSLGRAPLKLTILLPVGWEPGACDVQLVDRERRPRAVGSGRAEIRDYVTTLEAPLDLTDMPAGSYQLAIRRHGQDWHLFPANVE